MVSETAQVACFSQDGQSIDRSYPGDLAQELIILIVCQQRLSDLHNAVAFTDQASTLANNDAEHADGDGIVGYGPRYRRASCLIDIH